MQTKKHSIITAPFRYTARLFRAGHTSYAIPTVREAVAIGRTSRAFAANHLRSANKLTDEEGAAKFSAWVARIGEKELARRYSHLRLSFSLFTAGMLTALYAAFCVPLTVVWSLFSIGCAIYAFGSLSLLSYKAFLIRRRSVYAPRAGINYWLDAVGTNPLDFLPRSL